MNRTTCLLLLLAAGVVSQGQANTGRVLGTVTDGRSSVIPAASVTAVSNNTGAATSTKTTDAGEFLMNFHLRTGY